MNNRDKEIITLMNKYKGLFNKFIYRYKGLGFDPDDIKSECHMALIDTYNHFDEKRGCFGALLKLYLSAYLRNYVWKNRTILSPSLHVMSHNKLSKDCEKSKEEYLNATYEDINEFTCAIYADTRYDTEKTVLEKEYIEKLKNHLTDIEYKIILDRLEGKIQGEIGDKLGCSKQYVSQLEKNALQKISKCLHY